jgi:hypothetical protein
MGTPDDLIEVERAGRRCATCQTGRRWRQFEVVRPEGQQPVVLCPACFARYGAAPPVPGNGLPVPAASQPVPATDQTAPPPTERPAPATEQPAPAAEQPAPPTEQPAPAPAARAAAPSKERSAPQEDRLRKALRELPHGEHSVGRIAKAAGLNHDKTIRRLHSLRAAGEVQQIGKRWSNEPPSTDIEAAMDRLQARTSNLRIVRNRESVG